MKPAAQRLYEALLDKYGVEIADAFMAAMDDIRRRVDIGRITRAIEAGDLDGAISALNLDPAAFGEMLDEIAKAYSDGGKLTVEGLPVIRDLAGAKVIVRWDGRHVRAEAWLRAHSAELVTRIVEDQRDAVRARLVEGMAAGENPRTTALEIVGRLNRVTGRREGGVLGLTAQQAQASSRAKAELASDDAEQLRAYLQRGRRDKRFDRTITKAIREGVAPPADIAAKALKAYQGQLLRLRGQQIGRTEGLSALNASQDEAVRQLVDTGAVRANQVRRIWRSAGDFRVRDTHRALDGDSVGLDENFRSPSGAVLRFPGDPSAPAAERVACRCWLRVRVDWLSNR